MKPSNQPSISVIVPVYNRAGIVVPTLESLAAQTARPVEVILIDNNSTDGSFEVLTRWAEATRQPGFDIIVDKCTTPGAAAARNAGLAIARSKWVMFFDSDDTMPPGHLAWAIEAIGANPDADIIGWDYTSYDGVRQRCNRFFGYDMEWNNLFHGAMSSARWCARTELVRSAGGWNNTVAYWDDIELGARMLRQKPKTHYLGLSGIKVFEHSDSITATYSADPARIEPALASIAKTTGRPLWTDIKRAIEYGLTVRAGNQRGEELMQHLLANRPWPRSLMLRFAYKHTRRGRRGAATLLRPICRLCS